MARQFRLWENAIVTNLLPPSADAAGRVSSYVSLRDALKAYIVCEVNQGNAAQVTFTPLQATNSSGSNSKAIGAAPITLNDDTSTATGSDQNVAQTAAASFQTDTTLKNKLVIFEIDPAEVMDINNTSVGAFQHIAIQTSASNAANITSALLVVTPLRNAAGNPNTCYV
jgi:hypothetical protein